MKNILILIFVILMMVSTAGAAEHYLATTGSDGNGGTSLSDAWLTPSYAVAQIAAGDTLWVVDGLYNEPNTFEVEAHQFGNTTHWTKIIAYNGTPVFDGGGALTRGMKIGESPDPHYNPGYVHLEGLTSKSYGIGIIYVERVTDVTIINCSFEDSLVGLPTWRSLMDLGDAVRNITITGCNFNDTGNFGINLMGDRNNTDGVDTESYNIIIDNCYFENTTNHDALQIGNYAYNITVSNNTFVDCYGGAGTYFHEIDDQPNRQTDISIRDNIFTNMKHYAIFAAGMHHSIIENNIITNTGASAFVVCYYANNVLIRNNTVINASRMYDDNVASRPNIDLIFEDNIYDTRRTSEDYYGRGGGKLTIRNDAHKSSYRVEIRAQERDAYAIFEHDDGRLMRRGSFTNPSGSNWSITELRNYPLLSNYTVFSNDSRLYWDAYTYNTTAKPQNGYLYDASVVSESTPGADGMNVSLTSSTTDNPTRVTSLMQRPDQTYNVLVGGNLVGRWVSDANKIMKYQHNAPWSGSTVFEFAWHSTEGYSGAPDAKNLEYTAGPEWVRHTWEAGDGIITDSYNVNVNGTWFNGTTDTYFLDETVPELGWSDIRIFGYNNTLGLSQFDETNSGQSLQIPWAVSIYKAYYNSTDLIYITALENHTNLFTRRITEADNVCTFSMRVTL